MRHKKQNRGNQHPKPPSAASKRAMKSAYMRLDMRRRDPWAITAPPDTAYRYAPDVAYVERTTTDRYGHLVDRRREKD
jgi:hypothetical protein